MDGLPTGASWVLTLTSTVLQTIARKYHSDRVQCRSQEAPGVPRCCPLYWSRVVMGYGRP